MKWLAMAALAAAIVLKLTWRRSIDVAIPVSATVHRGYPVSSILFWILLATPLVLFLFALFKHSA